ncbi:MAG TPA: adenylyl-sulfate kinase, partial [Acidimicrobiales bacterium]|nr:adenylyl-sulfate kinase [Acidimicrobiales bacterium]
MRGATVWFTGLSGSGKSTVATAVERRLVEAGAPTYLLGGEILRHGPTGDLGFGPAGRGENVRRVGEVARLGLHPVGKFEALDSGRQVRFAVAVREMFLIQPRHEVEHGALV